MATREGSRALRSDADVGTLEVGKRGDVIVIDGARLGGGGDPATRIVFGGGGRGVRDVLVDGTLLVRDGIPMTLDAADVRAKGAEALAALASDPAMEPIAGGTDLMVEVNADRKRLGSVVAIDRVAELRELSRGA